jgi:thiol:disulfide interchange protein
MDVETTSPEELTLRFATEETAPVAALQAGSARLGFSFRLTYWDSHNAGWATVEENQEVDYDYEQAPEAQGIPQDVIDDFQLNDVYQRHREGTI